MPLLPRQSRPPYDGDELIADLRRYARERAPAAGEDDAANVELSLLHLQKLATLGQLAADVARDFGNLMTVMLGYSELMLFAAEKGEPPEHEHLTELRLAAEQASALTTRLLGFSRRTADDPTPQDLGLLVGALTPWLGRLIGSGNSLAVTTDPTAGAVRADGKQIEQVIINLVLNARDAIKVGGRVEVAVDPVRLTAPLTHALGTVPAGDYVRLRIRDDGCGMSPGTVAQLFRPFFTSKSRGAGLGLTIVARIARRTNAAVVVESIVGKGTTVDLYFPRLDAGAGR
jgi:two-component system, cell cycle sensor histidine kinase and response regulator CckA